MAGVMRISWRQAGARRLVRHGLAGQLPSVTDAAAAVCGAHAQVMSAAEISLGLRVAGATRTDVAAALWRERSLVKTLGPRGTVHLLPAGDLPTWCAALSAVPHTSGMPAGVRLDDARTDAVVGAIDAALTGAVDKDGLTVEELDAAVGRACGDWAVEPVMPAFGGYWSRWRQVIGTAAARGVLCFGPPRGRRVTYSSPRRWLAEQAAAVGDPVAWLARRYLHAYGPAAPQHFAQWLAAPRPWAAAVFAGLALEPVDLDGTQLWTARGDTDWDADAIGVRLLPYFDSFAVGSHPRAMLYPGRAGDRALAGSQAGNFPVLLVDGTVAGVWHSARSGRRMRITVEPLRRLAAGTRRAVQAEAERVATIAEGRAEVTFGTVTVGPHA